MLDKFSRVIIDKQNLIYPLCDKNIIYKKYGDKFIVNKYVPNPLFGI